jgi:Flp pilus assembly protein TadB
MNKHSQTITDFAGEVVRALLQTARFCMRTLTRMSWPALLGFCVVLAFMATILPLALLLFAFFLLLKLAVGALVLGNRRQRRNGERQQ